MSIHTGTGLAATISIVLVLAYHLGIDADFPRIGLFAGLGVGAVFGTTLPVEAVLPERILRAVRTSAAFAVTTGLGYTYYQGTTMGLAWGIGGMLGCVAGVLTAQLVRGMLERGEPDV